MIQGSLNQIALCGGGGGGGSGYFSHTENIILRTGGGGGGSGYFSHTENIILRTEAVFPLRSVSAFRSENQ